MMGHFLSQSHPEMKLDLFKSIEDETLFLQLLHKSNIQFPKKD